MPLIRDVTTENSENTLSLPQETNWLRCSVGKLNVRQAGLLTDLDRERVLSGFITCVTEIPTAQAYLSTPYLMSSIRDVQEAITVPIYGTEKDQWASNKFEYAVGATYPIDIEITVPDTGTATFISVKGGIFPIGCPISVANYERQLPASIEKRLEKIEGLKDNWDSYSASQISSKAIEKAKFLLKKGYIHCGRDLLEETFIAPCSDGGIQLEWTSESELELIVKITPSSKEPTFLLTEPSGKEKEGTIRNPEDWNMLLDEFCKPKA